MNVEVGQTIYVSASNIFMKYKPNLDAYVVTKVNTRSIYARKIGGSDFERRFDKRTMTHESFGDIFKVYLTEKEYWDKIKQSEDKRSLLTEIKKSLNGDLSIDKLKRIFSIVKE